MLILRLVWILLVGIMILGTGVAWSQDFPNKPIRIVVGGGGSGTEVVARIIAQGISESLGQPVIVDGRGGSVIIVVDIVRRAPHDGYTMLVAAGSFMLLPFLRDQTPYDPVKDFAPVSLTTTSPIILVAHPSLGVKNVKELIALAKAKPGVLNYGMGSVGATVHLSIELLKSMTGINIVQINYSGTSLAQNALMAGEIQISGGVPYTLLPHIKSGKLVGLGVTSLKPSPLAPGMPTIESQGLPGFEVASTIGMFVPAGTPPAVINRLNQEIVRFLKKPDVMEKFLGMGAEAVGSSPQEFAATMKSEMTKMGKVIKDAGIREQ